MTFPEFLLFLVFFSYCACYAFSLRKGKIVFDTTSDNEIHIGKNGCYSVWHDRNGQISFHITDLNGREVPLSKPLFHASFRRTGGRITLLKQGRLKKGSYTIATPNNRRLCVRVPPVLLRTADLSGDPVGPVLIARQGADRVVESEDPEHEPRRNRRQ